MAIVTPAAEPAPRKRGLSDDGGIRVFDHELTAENQAVPKRLAGVPAGLTSSTRRPDMIRPASGAAPCKPSISLHNAAGGARLRGAAKKHPACHDGVKSRRKRRRLGKARREVDHAAIRASEVVNQRTYPPLIWRAQARLAGFFSRLQAAPAQPPRPRAARGRPCITTNASPAITAADVPNGCSTRSSEGPSELRRQLLQTHHVRHHFDFASLVVEAPD
jgi:hypothetical protein